MTAPRAAAAAAEAPRRQEQRLRRRCAAMVLGLAITLTVFGFWVRAVRQAPGGPAAALVQSLGWRGGLPARGGNRERASVPAAASPDFAASTRETVKLEAPPKEPPPKVRTYQVQSGDTVSGIAERFGLNTETVLWANDLSESSVLQIAESLRIPSHDGILYQIEEGDTLWDLARYYRVEMDQIIIANPDVEPGALQLDQWLLIPGARPGGPPAATGAERPAPAPPAAPSALRNFNLWPLQGPITSPYGYRIHPVYGRRTFHEGMDIAAPPGTPIVAVAAGRVTLSGWYGGWGLSVKVDHDQGVATRYSHASVLLVKSGEWVDAGQPVARVGSTGISTGPHLDFGVYVRDQPQDPAGWLP